MKLTDLAIVFQLFFICLITVLHVKSDNLYASKLGEIMYDNVMDGIVEDSLRAGYKTVDVLGKPVVELSDVKSCFKAETGLYNVMPTYILMYVDDDGFYIWNSGISDEWSEKITFSDKNATAHEQKIFEITSYIENKHGITLSVPYNQGESFANTIADYSLIAVSYNKKVEVISFSGAKIHNKKESCLQDSPPPAGSVSYI